MPHADQYYSILPISTLCTEIQLRNLCELSRNLLNNRGADPTLTNPQFLKMLQPRQNSHELAPSKHIITKLTIMDLDCIDARVVELLHYYLVGKGDSLELYSTVE